MRIILVSARMPRAMTYLQHRLGIEKEPIICYNGALVLDGDNELSSTNIEMRLLEQIYQLASEHSIKLGLYYKDEWYVGENTERVQKEIRYTKTKPLFRETSETLHDWKNRDIGAHKIMLMGTKNTADTIFPLLEQRFSVDLHLYRSNDTLIEIAPKSVSKLSAIKLLLKDGESLADVLSFGDNYNDIEMLEHSGCGVAVGNAKPAVKYVADTVTLPNFEDGVAHYIEQHLLF